MALLVAHSTARMDQEGRRKNAFTSRCKRHINRIIHAPRHHGLDPRAFLGAFHHALHRMGTDVVTHFDGGPVEGFEAIMSLNTSINSELIAQNGP